MRKVLISLAAVGAIFFAGCADEKKKETAYVESKTPAVMTQEQKSNLLDKAQEEAAKIAQEAKESTEEAIDETKEALDSTAADIQEEITKKAEAIEAEISSATEKISQEIEEKVEAVTKSLTPKNDKGAELYLKCSACHGQKGEKKALGASEIIQGWEIERTVDSLKGYQNKTYGGKMKTIMTGQVATLSDDDIQALAEHLAGL
ncbi:MAG: c-type cytochrome [Arcobacteraceae bacterium]